MKSFLIELWNILFLIGFVIAFGCVMTFLFFHKTTPNWIAYVSFPYCVLGMAYTNYTLKKEKAEQEKKNENKTSI